MEKVPRLNTEQRSNLVAYLDGELPEPQAKEIDQVLAKSPTVRHDVEMLSRTWDLLEQLPRLAGSTVFAADTLAVAKAAEEPKSLIPREWIEKVPKEGLRRGAIIATWVISLAVAAVLGFAITNKLIPDESQDLLQNLPVIEKLDMYSNVGSVEFLRELDQRIGSFDDQSKR
jgi:anti-sigma factor RsiW